MPRGSMNLNVQGRQLTNPLQGFGQMWQKTYRIKLIAPRVLLQAKPPTRATLLRAGKRTFRNFGPAAIIFTRPLTEIQPGEVAVLNLKGPGGMPLSTGIRVIYADDEQFSFMTPEGHMFAGMITFSSYEEEDDVYVQMQALIRASDPARESFSNWASSAKWKTNFGRRRWKTSLRISVRRAKWN